MYDITPNLSWVFSLVSSNTLFQQICVAFSKIVGIWWSGPLLFTTPLSSLSHCSRNSQYIFIFCYDLISTDPTLPTVFFLGKKEHRKRVI
ncbi:hypothetical protein EDB85DRAFT_44768 [Lactarius pseudohatsudake]|nr:hypothetical protein EDB85DRAFT_44768 [Lactarius pseudohatsudake]